MKRLLTSLLGAACFALNAQNLLNNADFQYLCGKLPADWGICLEDHPGSVELLPNEGPQKQNAVRLDLRDLVYYSQGGVRLAPGETYEIGAWVRTKDFHGSRSGVIVYNMGWFDEAGATPIPADTSGGWVKLSATITCPLPDSKRPGYFRNSPYYGFCIYATEAQGELDVASPFLIPLSEKAKEFSRPATSLRDNVRAVPLSPRLSELPSHNAVLDLYWPNAPEGKVRCTIISASQKPDERNVFEMKGEFADHRVKLTFPKLPAGPGILQLDVDQGTGDGFLPAGNYAVNVLAEPEPSEVRALNNLVSEISYRELEPGRYVFSFAEGGWMYLKSKAEEIRLDGNTLAGFDVEGSREFMCRIPAGNHEIRLDPAAGAPEALRRIPELLIYALDDPEFDGTFWEKYLLPQVNAPSMSFAWVPWKTGKELYARLLKTGRWFICNGGMHARKKYDPLQLAESFRNIRTLMYENCAFVYDELNPASHSSMITAFAEALWQLQKNDAPVYLWSEWGGRFLTPQYHANLISALSNSAGGRGRILAESYCRVWADEELMNRELARYRKTAAMVSRYYPTYTKNMEMITGGYLTPGGSILETSNPECDPKAALDRYFRMCAVDPEFEGLYGIGVYFIRDTDEELVRWIGKLLRHYGIEGQKELLSEKYGFQLKTEFLKNGDFTEGLEHWKTEGNVTAGRFENLGKMQGRQWGRGEVKEEKKNLGDSAALLPPGSSVIQTAQGLIPGRRYSVTGIVAAQDMLDSKNKGKKFQPELKVTVSGADQVEQLSTRARVGDFQVVKVLFTATGDTADVTFTALKEKPESMLLNFVSIRPYFTDEK